MAALGASNSTPPFQTMGNWLAVGLCYDCGDYYRDIHDEHLQAWGISFGQALQQAVADLRGTQQVTLNRLAEGHYCGSWIRVNAPDQALLPEMLLLADFRAAVPGQKQLVAALPHRASVFIAVADENAALRALLREAEAGIEEERPLSPMPILWDGTAWRDWVCSPSEPYAGIVERLRRLAAGQEYTEQQKILNQLYKVQKKELFVATFQFSDRPGSEDILTVCTWTEGVPSLLPRTDVVVLLPKDHSKVKGVHWEQLMRVLGPTRLEEQKGYCPRFKTVGFPTPSELAQLTDALQQFKKAPEVDSGPPTRSVRMPERSRKGEIVMPLQVHQVVHPELGSERKAAEWEKVVADINGIFEGVGIRFVAEVAPLEVPDAALQVALPNAKDSAVGSRTASCLALLDLPGVRPRTLQLFCLGKIPTVGGTAPGLSQGYLFNESLVLLTRDHFSDKTCRLLSYQLARALGLAMRSDGEQYLLANSGGTEFAPEERKAVRFRASRLLANSTRTLLPVSVQRVVNGEFGTTVTSAQALEALDRASLRLERLGLSLNVRSDSRAKLASLDGLRDVESWDEGAVNLCLFKMIPGSTDEVKFFLEPAAIFLTEQAPLDQRVAVAATGLFSGMEERHIQPKAPLHVLLLQVHQVVHPRFGSRMAREVLEAAMSHVNAKFQKHGVRFEPEFGQIHVPDLADSLQLLDLPGVRPGVPQVFIVGDGAEGAWFPNGVVIQPESGASMADVLFRRLAACLQGSETQPLAPAIRRQALRQLGPYLPVHLYAAPGKQEELVQAFGQVGSVFGAAVVALGLRGVSRFPTTTDFLQDPSVLDTGAINVMLVDDLRGQVFTKESVIMVSSNGAMALEKALGIGLWRVLGLGESGFSKSAELDLSLEEAMQLHAAAEQYRVALDVLHLPVQVHLVENESYPCSWTEAQVTDFFAQVNAVFQPAKLAFVPRVVRSFVVTASIERALPNAEQDAPKGSRKRDYLPLQATENFDAATLNLFLSDKIVDLGTKLKLMSYVAIPSKIIYGSLYPRDKFLKHHCVRLAQALGVALDKSDAGNLLMNWGGDGTELRALEIDKLRARATELLDQQEASGRIPPVGAAPELRVPVRVHLVVNGTYPCSWRPLRAQKCFDDVNKVLAQANVRLEPHILPSVVATEALEAAFHRVAGSREGMSGEKLVALPGFEAGKMNVFLLDNCVFTSSGELSWGGMYSRTGVGVLSIRDGGLHNVCVSVGVLFDLSVPKEPLPEPRLMNRKNRGFQLTGEEIAKLRAAAQRWV